MPLLADLGAVACLEFAAMLGRFADATYRSAREMVAVVERLGWFVGAWYVVVFKAFSFVLVYVHARRHSIGDYAPTPDSQPFGYYWPLRRDETLAERIRDGSYEPFSPDAHHVDENARKQLEEIDAIIEGCST